MISTHSYRYCVQKIKVLMMVWTRHEVVGKVERLSRQGHFEAEYATPETGRSVRNQQEGNAGL